jgi:hypothetical protein
MTTPANDDRTILSQEIQDILHRNQELVVAGQFAAMVMHEINGPPRSGSQPQLSHSTGSR